MACTQQSALKYIRNSTTHLIGRLRNLPLIVEKLHQCRVLNEYEVSDINSIPEECKQTRRILEMVIAEGEEACYEFLKILDVTRKRTLPEQQQDFSASQNGSSCDLHQWITSFPFREDQKVCTTGSGPCHKYQRELKEKAEQVVKYEWLKQTMIITKDESKWKTLPYTPLVLDADVNEISKSKSKKYRKPRPKKLKTFIPKDKSSLSPVDLLKTNEKKILLVGKPGIGKTTIAQQILSIWAEKEGCDLDYMFYFDESNFSNISKPISLKSLLFMYCEPPEAKDEVLQDIEKNSEDVVIIFDGIRDLGETSVLHQVLNNNLLRNAKIIVTCRPEDVSEGLLSYWPTYKVEVLGFSGESIRAYFNNIFSTDTDTAWSVLKNLELFTLCHVPMYAFIVAVCLSFGPCSIQDLPSTITAVYLHIFRLCIQKHGKKSVKKLDKYIQDNRGDILCLAETSYKALLQKTVCLNGVDWQEHSVQCAFLRSVVIQKSPSSAQTISSFLHNTMQEFWAALWLLENPEKISEILLRCQTEEGKYLRYILPFLCGFLFEQNSELVRCVVPEDQVKTLSEKLPVDIMNTFLLLGPAYEHENARLEFETENLLFVCECLYESRSEKACSHFLKELGYHFDLREENLDPHQCCAVSYVVNQAEDRSVQLDLENSTVTDPGWKLILSCVKKVQMLGLNPSMFSELWETALHCGQQCDFADVLRVCGSEIHFPVQEDGGLCETAGYVMKQSPEKVKLCLHWDKHIDRPAKNFTETISQCLSNIATIRFIPPKHQMGPSEEWKTRVSSFKMDLCLQGALYETETGQRITGTLMSALSLDTAEQQSEFLLDLYSHVKDYETQTGRSVLSALQTLYQSAPAEWVIDLSKRKASLFLEVLKLQTVTKPVKLMGWTDEEGEVWIFLECLPYISELGFIPPKHQMGPSEEWKTRVSSFKMDLCLQGAFYEKETGQKITGTLMSALRLDTAVQQSEFLLDLYSHVKDYETQTGRSVLSALQTLYQSAPAEWVIDLSKRKASLFLEVLKLQTVKKPVKLMGWTDEEGEVRIFLECLPYISELGCDYLWVSEWVIDLSKRKASLFLEVLKLQRVKKPVKLMGWTDEEGEVWIFLECLPYISQLRFIPPKHQMGLSEEWKTRVSSFKMDLCLQGAFYEKETGQKITGTLISALRLDTAVQQSEFLLDLYSHVKEDSDIVIISLQF
ncbi:hypothetical protein JZ751_023845 [Albula glossodonta]|uniref:Uncharacterized protein n=1 Tax=Albula glossodonta TaxID=121402 RepID=A0A8T2MYM1_9TELE|nr:hypothetical protein JZ751_023845 [Albula glossodonta]